MKNYILVVEGKSDITKIKSMYQDMIILKTNGLGYNDDFINNLIKLEENNTIILLFDPDSAGGKIRNDLAAKLKNPRHIYVDKNLCIKNNKVGIENINKNTLKSIFDNIITFSNNKKSDLKIIDLYNLKILGHPHSQALRNKIASHYHIGRSNGKRLYNVLKNLSVNKKDLIKIIKGDIK